MTFWQFTSTPVDRNIAGLSPSALREWAQGDADDDEPARYTPPKLPACLAPNRAKPSARTLQRALKAAGFMSKSVAESDNYGPKTQAAMIAFHHKHPQYRAEGVTRDPTIGPIG